jgi:hypothetical protein
MRKTGYGSAILLILILTLPVGCQNSPGSIFSPESDLFVAKVEPSFLQPEEPSDDDNSSSSGESAAKPPVFPAPQIYFNITNGVSVFLNSYIIRYYTTDGNSLNKKKYDHSGAISLFVKAPEISWGTTENGSSGSGSDSGGGSSSDSGGTASIRAQAADTADTTYAGNIMIEVYSPRLYSFMTKDTAKTDDDISPVIAEISFFGKDINDKEITAFTRVTLVTTLLESDDN